MTPNWFASVMGTGIVANAAASVPLSFPGIRTLATTFWLIATAMLIAISAAFAWHWWAYRERARVHARDPIMGHFYGAPPMAMLTVGAGTLVFGPSLIGPTLAVWIDIGLWIAGTTTGLMTAVWLPFRMVTSSEKRNGTALPAWLMPIVPPMVSASTGSLLLPHLGAGQPQLTLLAACYLMCGLSLILGMMTMTLIYSRLIHHGAPPVQAIPTVWITLGMIGQSITAVNLLPVHAESAFIGQPNVTIGLHVFGIIFGFIMGGLGVFMFVLATLVTAHAARRGLSFSMAWWSFTFPIGTCVTGAAALGAASGLRLVDDLSIALLLMLVCAWLVVAAHTVRTSMIRTPCGPPVASTYERAQTPRV